MAQEPLYEVMFSDIDLNDFRVLSRRIEDTYSQAIALLREIAVTRDHVNARFQKAIMISAYKDNISIDVTKLPLLYSPVEIHEAQGVVTGMLPQVMNSIVGRSIKINVIAPVVEILPPEKPMINIVDKPKEVFEEDANQ